MKIGPRVSELWDRKSSSPIDIDKAHGLYNSLYYRTSRDNNNHDDIYSAIIYGASHMREFTLGHLDESQSAPGGRQLVGQAANLTFESACSCAARARSWVSQWVSLKKKKQKLLSAARFDPGTSRASGKRAATRPRRPATV